MRRHCACAGGIGLAAIVAFLLLSVTTGYASTASTTAVSRHFPSAGSTVVGSVGFINGTEIGYFWSVSRGDGVSQTVRGPTSIRKAVLKVDVVTNSLTPGAEVDWAVLINGVQVGSFTVVTGETGPVRVNAGFAKIFGPTYAVHLKVTNEVAGGDGSISLAYAGAFPHTITLFKKP